MERTTYSMNGRLSGLQPFTKCWESPSTKQALLQIRRLHLKETECKLKVTQSQGCRSLTPSPYNCFLGRAENWDFQFFCKNYKGLRCWPYTDMHRI